MKYTPIEPSIDVFRNKANKKKQSNIKNILLEPQRFDGGSIAIIIMREASTISIQIRKIISIVKWFCFSFDFESDKNHLVDVEKELECEMIKSSIAGMALCERFVGIEQSSFIIILFNFINGASAHPK